MLKWCLLLVAVTILCYLNSFNNTFLWDDINNIVNNESLKETGWRYIFLRPFRGFYRPVSYLSMKFDYWLWRENHFGYHLTNLFIHLSSVIIIFFIAQKLSFSNITSFFTALLFAIHPVHTEAVTYISGRADPICAFFLFSSFYLYIKQFKIGSLILFLPALLAKEVALIFPLLCFVYNLSFLKKGWKDAIKSITPFLLLAIAFLLLRTFFVRGSSLNMLRIGTLNNIFRIGLFYMGLIVFPFSLHVQHSLKESAFLSDMPFILSAVLFLGIIFIILKFIKKNYIRFGVLWFIISILPFLGILKLNPDAEIAEHWLYIPSFGLFLIFGELLNRWRIKKYKVITFIIIGTFSFLTVRQNTFWQDDLTFYKYTLRYYPHSPKFHYNLGNAYLRKNIFSRAKREYSLALKLKADYAYALNNLSLIPSAFAEEESFDHSLYGMVLSKYVRNGWVDYNGLKDDPSLLYEYVKKIGDLKQKDLEALSYEGKLAFYINAYNALTLKVIVDYYPVKSIKDIPGVWNRLKFEIAGRELTLNQIEHQILRREFSAFGGKEPRIHFALVCASKGCPQLPNAPFSGKDLNAQLDREARKFINDKTKVRLDRSNRTLYVSSIFKWFKEDFGDIIKFISKYLPEDSTEFIEKTKLKIKYLNYDWSLNE